jgi:crossover junction endodeoxyribonuclease RuvC
VIALGIDPGSRRCGYGVVAREGTRLVVLASGVLVPGADRPVAERLARILDGLVEVIRHVGPAECSIEQVFCGASPRSALVLGQARGVALAAAAQAGLPVFEYAPSEVKLAFTGSGRATKDQMLRTARLLLGAAPGLSDEADALAVAVCHLARRAGRLAVPALRNVAVAVPPAGGRARQVLPAPARDRAARAAARLRPARRDHRGLA